MLARTIKNWNNLPINVIEARDINEFTFLIIVILLTLLSSDPNF